jgi:hypothetical protein
MTRARFTRTVHSHRVHRHIDPYRRRDDIVIRVTPAEASLVAMSGFTTFYRRPGSPLVFVRDREGRMVAFRVDAAGVQMVRPLVAELGPVYGRVDFANRFRFSGRVRSQQQLQNAYLLAPAGRIKSTGVLPLPAARVVHRREPHQGMAAAMAALGAPAAATAYATWTGLVPAPVHAHEWCHLAAHSMGGADGPHNIVAAGRGNNSEQLAIENTLARYRRENLFQVEVGASVFDTGNGRHLGDVIRYRLTTRSGQVDDLVLYLDCRVGIAPSAIHFEEVSHTVSRWANAALEVEAEANDIAVTGEERRAIQRYRRERNVAIARRARH